MTRSSETLVQLLEPVIAAMGYELVGVDYRPNPHAAVVRIYLDKPGGITLEDCEKVSRQVSGVLDVEDPIASRYTLEVSSPGLDRPIFKVADFDRFAGEKVRLRLQSALEGRRKIAGTLRGLREECVIVEENGVEVAVPLGQIDKANLELEA
jgi:ribosome maturation factor RimP